MRKFLEISRSGLDALLLHPLRSTVTVLCLLAVLTPFVAGAGMSRGLTAQADIAVTSGADLYVSGLRFGRPAPVPLALVAQIERIEGVNRVVPRIVGRIALGKENEPAVLVGLPPEALPDTVHCIEGRMFGERPNELVVGSELARRLRLKVDAAIPPFYRSSSGDRVSTVVGLFEANVSLWQSNLIFASFDTAAHVFDQSGEATDLLVYTRPGYEREAALAVTSLALAAGNRAEDHTPLRVTSRDELLAVLPRNLLHREGIVNLHFLLLFAAGIPLVLVTSGAGLTERRREVGILKALGWQTDEVLLRGLVESACLSLFAAAIAVLLAFVWLRLLNGYWIASVFLPGVDAAPSLRVPFRLTPGPALLGLLVSFVLVMTGTLYSSWRAAVAPPSDAMR